MFQLTFEALEAAEPTKQVEDGDGEQANVDAGAKHAMHETTGVLVEPPISYEASEVSLSWLGRLMFAKGTLPLASVRGVVMMGSAMASGLLALLLTGLALLLIFSSPSSGSMKAMQIAVVTAIEALIVWRLGFVPWQTLVDDRVKMAEEVWTTFSQRAAQIELLRRDGRRYVRIVQYMATCPVCGAVIHVEQGKREFHHRLVGRCAESPREHVFSFDRVTRRGYALRQSGSAYRT